MCKWHDHYIKCMPKTHVDDDINIYCDVRQNNHQAIPNKWKCKHPPYNSACNWNEEQNKCVPNTSDTINLVQNIPKGNGKGIKSKSSKKNGKG